MVSRQEGRGTAAARPGQLPVSTDVTHPPNQGYARAPGAVVRLASQTGPEKQPDVGRAPAPTLSTLFWPPLTGGLAALGDLESTLSSGSEDRRDG